MKFKLKATNRSIPHHVSVESDDDQLAPVLFTFVSKAGKDRLKDEKTFFEDLVKYHKKSKNKLWITHLGLTIDGLGTMLQSILWLIFAKKLMTMDRLIALAKEVEEDAKKQNNKQQ